MKLNKVADPAGSEISQRARRTGEKKRQILEAAIRVFLEHGFAGSSIDQIVAESKISKRTMYNHYKGKEEIFIGAMEYSAQNIYQRIEGQQSSADGILVRLRNIGISILTTLNRPVVISLSRTVYSECARFPKISRNFFLETNQALIGQIAKELEESQDKGQLDFGDVYNTAEYYLELLIGIKYWRVVYNLSPPMDQKAIAMQTDRALSFFAKTYDIRDGFQRGPGKRPRQNAK